MKILKITLIISVSLNIAVVGAFLYVRWGPWHVSADDPAARELGLNGAQRTALAALRRQARDEIIATFRQNRTLRQTVIAQLRDTRTDDPALEKNLRQAADVRFQLQLSIVREALAFRDALPADQRAHFNDALSRPRFLQRLIGFDGAVPQPEDR